MRRLRHFPLLGLLLLTACNLGLPFGLSVATPTAQGGERTPEASVGPLTTAAPQATATGSPSAPGSVTATPSATAVPPLSLQFLRMVGAQNGWATDEAHVYRTNDGGTSWLDVTPSGLGSPGFRPTAYFSDAARAWISVSAAEGSFDQGTLFHTEDGGLSWTSSSVPFGRGFLRFVDARNGWMMADLGGATGKMAIAIYRTANAGQTWQRVYHNDPTVSGTGTSLPLGGQKLGLTPGGGQKAWVGGATNEPGTIYLYRSLDGGRSWAKQNPPLPPDSQDAFFITEGPVFSDATHGLLPVKISTSGIQMLVYATADGGSSWQLLPGKVEAGRLVDFLTGNDGFIWGNKLFFTRDRSQTWVPVESTPAFGENLSVMDFVDSLVGWGLVTGEGDARSLYKTVDGGVTWTRLEPVVTSVKTGRATVYLTLVGDNGQNGDKLGCGDSLVPVEVDVAPSDEAPVETALKALLGIRVRDFEGKYNGLYLANLQLVKTSVTDKRIIVYLEGQVASGGECDDPRIIGQIRRTITQFGFQDVTVLVGGRKLEDLLSLKGK